MTPSIPFLRRFLLDEEGSVTVEAMLMFPLLCWAYMATQVFFDGFHAQSVNVRTAYTIGDIVSRETTPITPEYVDSLYALQGVLQGHGQGGREPRRLRLTLFEYLAPTDSFRVVCSQQRGGATTLTSAQLTQMRAQIPVMANHEYGILTQTWRRYSPPATIGVEPLTMAETMVTRPRFGLRVCCNSNNNDPTATATLVC